MDDQRQFVNTPPEDKGEGAHNRRTAYFAGKGIPSIGSKKEHFMDQEDRAREDGSHTSYSLSPLAKKSSVSRETSSFMDNLPAPMRPITSQPAFTTGRVARHGGLVPSYQGTAMRERKPQTPTMPYIPISHKSESTGHGRMLHSRGFADFQVPQSEIPLFAGKASFKEERAKLWPDLENKTLGRNAAAAVVYDRRGSARLMDDLQKLKARDGHTTASFPSPDYYELFSKAAGKHYTHLGGSHESIMQWHVDNYPNLRPVGREDVFKLETWLKQEIGFRTNTVRELERQLARESAQVGWTMEQHSAGTNWALQGYGWEPWLRQMMGFQDIYARGSRELVRQVSCQCVERGAVMDGVARGVLGLLDLAFDAFIKAARTADNLYERNQVLEGVRSNTKSAEQQELDKLRVDLRLMEGELEREKGKTVLMQQKLDLAEKRMMEKSKRNKGGGDVG
eukprot:CAMPEP_0118937226 /NCGR_PEP_ID=MMETSP1169-20130426/22044_1 /TAXON_ID=36882 /ORGANISM="Pyramimonas obovata, Strain CCMP722" /LENGTH=450 /DNA_ID=CAMNT_0006880801 /DNA_START=365 /DNA_END=1713 /DNA_ORIENTATION=-